MGLAGDQARAIHKTFWPVFEEFAEAISPRLHSSLSVGFTRQVAHFLGIFVQVEKMFLARLRIPDVLAAPIGDIVIAVVAGVTPSVFAVEKLPDAVGIALHDWQKAFARAGIGNVDAGRIEDGRHDVLDADGTVADDFFGIVPIFWRAHEKRNSRRRFIGPSFAKEIVIAQHFAVVGGEDD